MSHEDNFAAPEWATPKQIPKLEPAFTEPAIRWHIFHARHNGLEPHIRRIGRKVLVNVKGFRKWIANQEMYRGKP